MSRFRSVDDIFGEVSCVAGEGQLRQIRLADLQPYPKQPFRPYSEERLRELAGDIKQNGVLCPIIVRPMPEGAENTYQILAGHNRAKASKLAGLAEVPAIVKDADDDTAALIMINTNLNQRDKLLPSEKAFAYKIQLEAMKQQGKRNGNLCTSVAQVKSRDVVAENNGISHEQIRRYIRLTELIPRLLEMIDQEALPFMVGVYLSYLPKERQELLYNFMDANELKKISLVQAEVIKEYKETLDGKMLQLIFFGNPDKKKPDMVSCKIPTAHIEKYFPNLKPAAIEKELVKILDFYFSKGD